MLSQEAEDKPISHGWHWTYGWLRRREHDDDFGFAYEQPCGLIVYSAYPFHRNRAYLECREDQETGERYVCISHKRSW